MKSLVAKLISTLTLTVLLVGTALAADTTATFKVTGVYCDACQTKIQHALSKTAGVKSATVDLNAGSATVTFDDAKVKPQQIINIIEKEGYKAQLEKTRSGLPQPSGTAERSAPKQTTGLADCPLPRPGTR